MDQPNRSCPEDRTDMSDLLEQVYGSAFLALEAGATRDHLVSQIDEALECIQEMKEDGLLDAQEH